MKRRTPTDILKSYRPLCPAMCCVRIITLCCAVMAGSGAFAEEPVAGPTQSTLRAMVPGSSFSSYELGDSEWGEAKVGELGPIPEDISATGYDPAGNYYLWLRHIGGQQIGQNPAHTGFGGTRYFWLEDGSVVLLSGQVLVTNAAGAGGNVGVTYRRLLSDSSVLGLGYWYEVNQSRQDNTYQQFGPSLEYLRNDWRIRANGYVPVETDQRIYSAVTIGQPGTGNLSYYQNQLIAGGRSTEDGEVALRGFDIELGHSFDFLGLPFVEMYGGYYRFTNQGIELNGGKGGVRGWLMRNLSAEITVSDDDLFGASVFGGFTWYFGGEGRYNESVAGPTRPIGDFLTVPVRRNEQVVVREEHRVLADNLVVLTQATVPIQVVHVDSADAGAGANDGTFASPLGSLNDVFGKSAAGDIILVHSGSTFTDEAVVLKDNQRLLGEGKVTLAGTPTAQTPTVTTDLGVVALPETATGAAAGTAPIVTNSTGVAVVTLGTIGNTVSGLHIRGGNSAGSGIVDSGTGATNTTIDNVAISDFSAAGGFGVKITPSVNTSITNFDISNNDTNIVLNSTDSTIAHFRISGGRYGIRLGNTGTGIHGTTTIQDIQIDNVTNDAILLESAANGSITNITDITIDGGTGNGLRITNADAGATFNVANLDIGATTPVGGTGVSIEGNSSGTFTFDAASSITNPGSAAFRVDGGAANVTVGAPIANNANHAVEVQNMTGGSVDFNGAITETGTGLTLTNNVGTTMSFDGGLTINPIAGNPGLTITGGGTVSVTGAGNTVTTTNARAVDLQNVAIGASNVAFASVTANNSTAAGEGIRADNVSSPGTFTSTNTSVTGTGGTSVAGIGITNSSAAFNLTNVNISSTTGHGVEIASTPSVNVGNGVTQSTITGAGADAINVSDSNATVDNLKITNVANTTQDGIEITNANTDRAVTLKNLTLDSVDPPNGRGVNAHVNGTGKLTLTVENSSLAADQQGINVDQTGTGDGVLSFDTVTASSETSAGINIDGSGGTGTLFVTQFKDLTVPETAGGNGGISTNTVTFDQTPGGTIQQVTGGAAKIGSGTGATQRMQGDGLRFDAPTGDLKFTTIDIYNNNGTGLLVDTKTAGTTFNLVNGGGTINTTSGAALNLDPLTADLTFGTVSASGGASGITLDTVSDDPSGGPTALTIGTTTISNTTGTGLLVRNSPGLHADFGTTSISAAAQVNGDGVNLVNNPLASIQFAELDIATANGDGLVASDSGTVDVTNAAASTINAIGGTTLDISKTTLTSGGVPGIPFASLSSTNSPTNGLRITDDPTGSYSFTNLNINGSAGHGIAVANIGNLVLTGPNVTITNAGLDAINIINSDATIDQVTITDPVDDGIQVTNGSGTHAVTITNVNLATAGGDGILIANSASGSLTATIQQSTINATGNGILATNSTGGRLTLTVNDNGVTAGTDGLAATNDVTGGQFALDMNRNTITATTGTGIAIGETVAGTSTSLDVGLSFTGTNFTQSGFIPPDTMGAVGLNQAVELVNGRFAVYDKATGSALQASTLDQFWTNAGVTFTGSTFDPRILYDNVTGRWFAGAVDNAGQANNFLVAVSNSSDPTAGWTGFAVDSDTDDAQWADFDTMGVDADGLYLVANMFGITTGPFEINLLSIPKADLVGTTPTAANSTLFENVSAQGIGFAVQPVVDSGASDGQATLLSADPGGSSLVHRTNLLGPTGTPTLSATTDISVASYVLPPAADQPGAKARLDTGDSRFGGNVVQVGGSLWAVHDVTDTATGNAAVRWYEIDEATNTVKQSGTISDPNLDFYYPSIAVNNNGNVIIGFSGSSDNQFVSAYAVAGTTAGNVTTFITPQVLQPGVADYQLLDTSGQNRWGDYSATVVDPSDANWFWTFQEFVSAPDEWAVQVSKVQISQQPTQTATGGSVTITGFSDNTVASAADQGIVLSNVTFDGDLNTAGFQQVNGGNTAVGGLNSPVAGHGVNILSATGDVRFTDLDIVNQNGTGLLVDSSTTNGNTGLVLGVTGGTSTIATTNGPAVDVNRGTVALTFQRIDTNGAADGIRLNEVDGSFAVTGTGAAGTGGLIQGSTNAVTVVGSTTGTGLNANFDRVAIDGSATTGINAQNVSGLTVANSTFSSAQTNWTGIRASQTQFAAGFAGPSNISLNSNTLNGTGGTGQTGIVVTNDNALGLGGAMNLNVSGNTINATATGIDLNANFSGGNIVLSGLLDNVVNGTTTPFISIPATQTGNQNGAQIQNQILINGVGQPLP